MYSMNKRSIKFLAVVFALVLAAAYTSFSAASQTSLDESIQWVYSHVDEKARPSLQYHYEAVNGFCGPDCKFVAYTALVFTHEGRQFHVAADRLAEHPRLAEVVLIELGREFGIKINFEFRDAPGKPPAEVKYVGDHWPEKSVEFGVDAYHPIGGLNGSQIYEGKVVSDPRGVFKAVQKGYWFLSYWLFVKQ